MTANRIQDPQIREVVEIARSLLPSSGETAVGILIILFDELMQQTSGLFLGSESLELVDRFRPEYETSTNGRFQMRIRMKTVTEEDYADVEAVLDSAVHQWEDESVALRVSNGLIGSVRNILASYRNRQSGNAEQEST